MQTIQKDCRTEIVIEKSRFICTLKKVDSFHVFRMDWDEKEVRLYADDILLNRTPLDNTVNASYKEVANPFRQPHFIILNLALGATGGDLDKLPLPQKYEIDYVRIYQKKDSPHKGTIPYRAEK